MRLQFGKTHHSFDVFSTDWARKGQLIVPEKEIVPEKADLSAKKGAGGAAAGF